MTTKDADYIKFKEGLDKHKAKLAKFVKEVKAFNSKYKGVEIVFDLKKQRTEVEIKSLVHLKYFKKK